MSDLGFPGAGVLAADQPPEPRIFVKQFDAIPRHCVVGAGRGVGHGSGAVVKIPVDLLEGRAIGKGVIDAGEDRLSADAIDRIEELVIHQEGTL